MKSNLKPGHKKRLSWIPLLRGLALLGALLLAGGGVWPNQARAATRNYKQYFNTGTTITYVTPNLTTNMACPSSGDLGPVPGVRITLLGDTDGACAPAANRDWLFNANGKMLEMYNGSASAAPATITGTSVVLRFRGENSSGTAKITLFYTNSSGTRVNFTGAPTNRAFTTTRTTYTVPLTGQSANVPPGSRLGLEITSVVRVRIGVGPSSAGLGDLIVNESVDSDSTAPTSTITAPPDGAILNLATASPYAITGTAADNAGGTGVAGIEVSTNGGSSWNSATCVNCPTTGNTTANWTYDWTLPAENWVSHNLKSRATDRGATPNVEMPGAGVTVTVDRMAPTVINVTSTTANGIYKTGDPIAVTVAFSESVYVTGTPTLHLETGTMDRNATYTGGSGSNTLIFSYTVQDGDYSPDLDYVASNSLALSGGTIKDSAGNNAPLTLPSPGGPGSLGANKNIGIDALPRLVMTKSVDKAFGNPGEVLTYSVNYHNAGPGAAYNVVVFDTVPAYTTYVANSLRLGNAASTYATASPLTDAAGDDAGEFDGHNAIFTFGPVAADDSVSGSGPDEGKVYLRLSIN
jgi:uncharacterized repeat protein (TIGR01451 family)